MSAPPPTYTLYARQALARDPRSALVLVQIAMSYWYQRKHDDALAWAQRALSVDSKHPVADRFIVSVYWESGDIERFAAECVAAARRGASAFGLPDEALAVIEHVAAQTQLDEAFDYLDQAIALRDPALVHLAVSPQWDPLRSDPRFAERLRAMSLPDVG